MLKPKPKLEFNLTQVLDFEMFTNAQCFGSAKV